MGNYNPHAPQILGQEWVPIRNEDTIFSPAVNSVELGHGFVTTAAKTLTTARFYINDLHPFSDRGQTFMAAIYPRGKEDQTGPISSVTIPVNVVTATSGTLVGASSNVDALLTASTTSGITLDCSQANTGLAISFGVSALAAVLNGKRILDVSLVFGVAGSDDVVGPTRDVNTSLILLSTTATIGSFTNPLAIFGRLRLNNEIDRASYGEINQFWTANSPASIADRVPWTYTQLTRLDATATQIYTRIDTGTNRGTTANSSCYVWYAALEVTYCEEQRVAVGATQFGTSFTASSFGATSILGADQIIMHDMAGGLNPSLAAGDYLLMLSSANVGGLNDNQAQLTSDYPNLNALRQLYSIPSLPATRVNIPFPLIDHIGDRFTSEAYSILPQLTLHTSGGPLTEPHVYGRQGAAQVYGVNTATQEIYDDISGVSASYPQVRYYARRFGDTTVPLTLTGSGALVGSTASIAVADFDALAEILDGWREVTLRFSAAPTMGAVTGTPGWTWSAVGETAGNRWEVLAASAPAISGVPGNLYTLVPSPNQLGTGTYQPPSGDTVNLSWMPQGVASPWVSGASDDAATDAVLIFSQDPPTITGLALSAQTQTVTGIGLDCGTLPCCIPSGISYQRLTWSPPGGSAVLVDFDARNSAGWGTATTGQVYTDSGGTVPGNYNVVVGTASHTLDGAANVFRFSTVAAAVTDSHQEITLSTNVTSAGASHRGGLVGHFVDTSNFDGVDFRLATSGNMEIVIYTVTAGVQTGQTNVSVGAYQAGQQWRCVVDFNGSRIRAKAWVIGTTEPPLYQAEGTALLTSGGYGVRSVRSTGNTNTTAVLSYVDYAVSPSTWNFGGYELQRFDTVTTEFETIMLATSAAQVSFNDFEARVGITSVYRIRSLNALNFAGQWSAMVSGAPPTPGVTGGCTNMTGALIFTGNADQSGASNAAYAMVWENDPIEDFKLAEADMVSFQPMYGRDGSIAFHGTERGLEAFDRTLLLQSAAIDPTRLADAKTIRDLAWNDLPYICVRDDIGDRWFANVRIPAVNARLNRTKYMARVEIVETTQTPYPVDP